MTHHSSYYEQRAQVLYLDFHVSSKSGAFATQPATKGKCGNEDTANALDSPAQRCHESCF